MEKYVLQKNNKVKLFFSSDMDYGNLGDLLSRYIVEKLSGLQVEKYYWRNIDTHLDAIGSILDCEEICAPSVIWGSGFLSSQSYIKLKLVKWRQYLRRKYGIPQVCAVRGKLTNDIIKKAGIGGSTVFGDPALLMPIIYKKYIKKTKYKVGVVLHYSHEGVLKNYSDETVIFININRKYSDIEKFSDELLECDVILSSSLHGIILANAYKIPCVRLKINNISIHKKPSEEDFKFDDYISGLNTYCRNSNYQYKLATIIIDKANCINKLILNRVITLASVPKFNIDYSKLINSFPLPLNQTLKNKLGEFFK